MLNYRSKVKTKLGFNSFRNRYMSQGAFVFWFCVVNLTLGKLGPHPVGSYRGQGGRLSFLVRAKGR